MSFSAVVFSSDNIRGALLTKAFQNEGFDAFLYKNIYDAEEAIKTRSPSVVIIDKEGYFHKELNVFSSLTPLLKTTSVLVVANNYDYASLALSDVTVQWCVSNPLDLHLIVSNAKGLLTKGPVDSSLKELLPIEDIEEPPIPEEESLERDLMGYLGLK